MKRPPAISAGICTGTGTDDPSGFRRAKVAAGRAFGSAFLFPFMALTGHRECLFCESIHFTFCYHVGTPSPKYWNFAILKCLKYETREPKLNRLSCF